MIIKKITALLLTGALVISLAACDGKLDEKIGLVMSLSELGATEEMLPDMCNGTIILDGGYKVLTKDEVMQILKESL